MERTIFLLSPTTVQRAFFGALLEEQGYLVVYMASVEELRIACENHEPELLLVAGSESGGLAELTLKYIRSRAETLLLPALVLSSNLTHANKQRLLEAGAVDVVSSDCSGKFMCERVSDILENNQTLNTQANSQDESYTVLVVEDSRSLQAFYKGILLELNCQVLVADDGEQGWQAVRDHGQDIDLIISDLYMPNMNGMEFCLLVKNNILYENIPIIVVTTERQEETLITMLQAGVNDYITKPFGEAQLRARLQTHLRSCYFRREQQRFNNELVRLSASLEEKVSERTEQLRQANIDTIYKLAIACDYKDSNTANHIARVRYYVKELALCAGCDDSLAEELGYSSMMHDVGKLGIPDSILLKPGPLSTEEWLVMKSHPERGAELLGENPFYRHAKDISLYHHERYDGTGYPKGLKGEDIPFSARIVAIVDIFDALTSSRSYKSAWTIEHSLAELERLKNQHLDPRLVDLMIDLVKGGRTDYIRRRWPCAVAE
ncbi:MAG: response regulator [Pseudomonadales bacterium]|nr:response regulator [Pseudomonadales bacterium]